MINNKLKIVLLFLFCCIFFNANSAEEFNFDVTEVQIIENGNKFIGVKRGKVSTNDGIIINADRFEYIKNLNILRAEGNVEIEDTINNYLIFSDQIKYNKNEEIINTEGNSKAINVLDNSSIDANIFIYEIKKNTLYAKDDVLIRDNIKDYEIKTEFITYFKNEERIFTSGNTTAEIDSKYNFESEDVTFLKKKMELFSKKETIITDKSNLYKLAKFNYLIEKEELKGENIIIQSNFISPKSDKFYFKSAIINLKNKNFISKDVKINIHKGIFDNPDNDPRIIGVSSEGDDNKTKINKAIFTSCQNKEKCPPWHISAREIIHDKKKREILYNKALLRIYDVPVLYFPKFFHPDPTVDRRSGFLKPQFNNSNVLGSSFGIPYFSVLADNKDYTFTPLIFENNMQMFQNEYREINENSNFYTSFNFVNNYKSSLDKNTNSIFSIFSKYDLNLNLENFITSDLFIKVEKVTNDTFFKIFDPMMLGETKRPDDLNNLNNEIKLSLKHEDFNLDTGLKSYENLQAKSSDRYEYVFPYYNFNKPLSDDFLNGIVNLSSYGENILNNTNVVKSTVTNDINYESIEFISSNGLKSNYGVNIKNLNSVGKNHSQYKSSPQIELMGLIYFDTNYPLSKQEDSYMNYLVPKVSLKINPSDMKNYSSSDRTINVNNIFNNNRLGISDSLEAGRSLTLGIDYKKESINDINKFFEFKLASVLRDKEENFIPSKSSLNNKTSNLFGSVSNNFIDFVDLNYNFAIDNDLNTFEYNNFNIKFELENFMSQLNFVEESGDMGNSNFLESNTSFNVDQKNYLTFKTRRNRKLNLTEYYDLIYEYKNDCLTAGIKYKKTYYEDRDLKPSENIFLTVTLIPLTTYEQKVDR